MSSTSKQTRRTAIIRTQLLLALLFALNTTGCMTAYSVGKARGWPTKSETGATVPTERPLKGYYAVIPVAVAGDIVTSPLQFIAAIEWNSESQKSDFWNPGGWTWLGEYFTH